MDERFSRSVKLLKSDSLHASVSSFFFFFFFFFLQPFEVGHAVDVLHKVQDGVYYNVRHAVHVLQELEDEV
jgi:hypothetical protein